MSENGGDSGQEKSHDPTPSRIERARREGDVAQSKEINVTAAYVGLYLALAAASTGAKRSSDSAIEALILARENPSLAAAKTAISSAPAASAS